MEVWTQEVDEPEIVWTGNEVEAEEESFLSSMDGDEQADVMGLGDYDGGVYVGKVSDEEAMARQGWRNIRNGITFDSGSNVDITPEDENPEFNIRELTGPRRGKRLAAANGSEIHVKGEKCINMVTKEGNHLAWPFIAGSVKKTLKSVATTCDAGNNVLFTQWAAYVINLDSGNILEVDREGNDYTMEAWVRTGSKGKAKVSTEPSFHRQGALP